MAAGSPSPNPTRPSNTHLKNPESSSIRRSGSFNLSKTSIIAEVPLRNSGSKAGRDLLPCLRASFEQKENERDANSLKTPRAASSSKSVKSFMAPTISASSKAIAASPRKKILAERNEVTPVSRSLEFPPGEEISSKPEMGSGAPIVPGAARVASYEGVEMEEIGMKPDMSSGFRDILGSNESRKADPGTENQKYVTIPSFTPSPVLSPLDGDPSIPPYDPKTNYLSPRPRFLHYKPKTRFVQYRNKEGGFLDVGDGKQLQDSFSYESYEDTYEDTSESAEEAQSSPLKKKPEEESSLAKEEAEEVTDGTHVSEPEFKSKSNGNHFKSRSLTGSKVLPLQLKDSFSNQSFEDTSESAEEAQSSPLKKLPEEESSLTKEEAEEVTDGTHVSEPEFKSKPNGNHFKSRSLSRSKVLPLLLVVVIACLYAPLSNFPVISSSSSSSMLKNLYGLASRLRDWPISSVAYLNTMVSLPKEEFGSFELVNLTFSAVDQTVDFDSIFSATKLDQAHLKTETVQAIKENMVTTETEQAIKENMVEGENCLWHETEGKTAMKVSEVTKEDAKEYGPEKTLEDVIEAGTDYEFPGDAKADVHPVEYQMEYRIEENGMKEVEQEKSPSSHEALKEVECEAENIVMEVPEDVEEDVHPVEYEIENRIEEHGEEEVKQEKSPSSHGTGIVESQTTHFVGDSLSDSRDEYRNPDSQIGSEDKVSMRTMLGISLAVIMLAATMVFLHMKQKQTTVAAHEGVQPKKVLSVYGSSDSYIHAKGSPYQNVPMGVDMVGDSGPSEVSSSLHSSSSFCHQKTKRSKEEETSSKERRLRRDSAASSSISYGSFTTYERLSSAKKGCKDEDGGVTPVRRSSRIRTQVTSP